MSIFATQNKKENEEAHDIYGLLPAIGSGWRRLCYPYKAHQAAP